MYDTARNICGNKGSHVYGGGGDRGDTVVKVLCYKSQGRWFDSSWCHWNLLLT